ncbi:MAG TPA: hypothetical protein VFD59_12010 [Nocardioidaceae bacterium]|nr:hypothetical protein [Nocardioidaceae bacterium]
MSVYPLAFWPADLKTWVDIVGSLVTALAVAVGGIWAYFKFVKGRTYRPRLEVGLFGQWRLADGEHVLHCRVTVKNIGASKVDLLQKGTGLVVHTAEPAGVAPASLEWTPLRAFEILADHHWIEPGETVSDDLLLALGHVPRPVLFRCVLRWKWASGAGDIVIVTARKIIPIEALLDGTESGNPEEPVDA